MIIVHLHKMMQFLNRLQVGYIKGVSQPFPRWGPNFFETISWAAIGTELQ